MKTPMRRLINRGNIFTFLAVLICIAATSTQSAAQRRGVAAKSNLPVREEPAAPAASVSPVVFEQANISCADLNASSDPRFAHITTNNEFKLDFADPNGTFRFTHDSSKTITVSSSSTGAYEENATLLSFQSQIAILAVNVKVGNTSYVFPYNPGTFGDTNLETGDSRGISHISFCYGITAGPSAADSSITGRVTAANGRGIAGARLTLVNPFTGETQLAVTNAFGAYAFEGLETGNLYFVVASHKRHRFAENTKTVTLNDSLSDVNFTATP